MQVAAAQVHAKTRKSQPSEFNKPRRCVESIFHFNFLFTPHKVTMTIRCKFASFSFYILLLVLLYYPHSRQLFSLTSYDARNSQVTGADALGANDKQPNLLQVAAAQIQAKKSQPVSEFNKPRRCVGLIPHFNFVLTPRKATMAIRCKFASFSSSSIPTHDNLFIS